MTAENKSNGIEFAFKNVSDGIKKVIPLCTFSDEELTRVEQAILKEIEAI